MSVRSFHVGHERRGTGRGTFLVLAGLGALLLGLHAAASPQPVARVDLIAIDGAIHGVSQQYIESSIARAAKADASALIITLDTPGGLLKSTRGIVKAFFSSNVPVVVYVSPSGAQAGSAGVFVTLAAHIAAMAPGTNIGAAHPVAVGTGDTSDVMKEKILNDAVAFVRSIAEQRDRNPKWAEAAVRESISSTAEEALEAGVINLVCNSVDDVVAGIDGRVVSLQGGKKTIHTKGAMVVRHKQGWQYRLLSTISDPNIAYILMLLGMLGLIFELTSPGAILPGVVGGICLILAFFAFQTLPVNYAGLLLIIFAAILFVAETQIASHGILAMGGVIALLLGSIMLFKTPPFQHPVRVSWSILIPAAVTVAGFFVFAVGMGLRAQVRKPTTGAEGLVGAIAVAQTDLKPDGTVLVHGELWRASCDEPVAAGEAVRVLSVENLSLNVARDGAKGSKGAGNEKANP